MEDIMRHVSIFTLMIGEGRDPRETAEWKDLSKEQKKQIFDLLKPSASNDTTTAASSSPSKSSVKPVGSADPAHKDGLMYVNRRAAIKAMAKSNKTRAKQIRALDKEIAEEAERILRRMARSHGLELDTQSAGAGGGYGEDTQEVLDDLKATMQQLLDTPPAGTKFYHIIKRMMHGAGDNVFPVPQCAVLLEADLCAFVPRLVNAIRLVAKKQQLRISDMANTMPLSTTSYFRWKAMKRMAKEDKDADAVSSDSDASVDEMSESEEENQNSSSNLSAFAAIDATGKDTTAEDLAVADDAVTEEAEVLALAAQAEERLLQGGITSDPSLAKFYARLAFANAVSKGMTTQQYTLYTRCREAGFTNKRKTAAEFAALVPKPALSEAVLEVVAFLAFDRLVTVVEAANRIANAGVLTARNASSFTVEHYNAALASVADLPDELQSALDKEVALKLQASEKERLDAARRAMQEAAGTLMSQGSAAAVKDDAEFASLLRSMRSSSGVKRKVDEISR